MKFFLGLMLFTWTLTCTAQVKKMHVTDKENDTLLYYEYTRDIIQNIDLTFFENSNDSLNWRLWNHSVIYSLKIDQNGTNSFALTMFREHSKSKFLSRNIKFSHRTFSFDSSIASKILELLKSHDLLISESLDSIELCQTNKNGSQIIELSNPSSYIFRNYRCDYDSNEDAISKTIASISQIVNFDSIDSVFYTSLKPMCYNNFGHYGVTCKKSAKDIRLDKKLESHHQYMGSVKDTVSQVLETVLNNRVQTEELYCYNYFFLNFSNKGRLKRIKSFDETWFKRLFDQERQKCKQHIRKALKGVRIDFIHPKREFFMRLSFEERIEID